MPIQVGNSFIKFRYEKDFERYPQLKVPEETYNFLPNLTHSNIIFEGGNCVRHKDKTIATDIIFKQNPEYKQVDLLRELENLLQTQLIIIPHEPYDTLGHSDGMVRWVDGCNVFVNEYSNRKFLERLMDSLFKHNLGCILFPFTYDKMLRIKRGSFREIYRDADEYHPAPGYYINYLHVDSLIITPTFGFEADKEAIGKLQAYFPMCQVVPIDCYTLSMEGGLINCISMNYSGRKLCFP